MEEDLKFKELVESVKQTARQELEYSKLTLAEKMSILLYRAIVVIILVVFGSCLLSLLLWGLNTLLVSVTHSWWIGVLLSIGVLLLLLLVLYACRKPLLIDPVTRFVTKLLLNPDEK